jgi:putative flippase GtrA
VATSRLPTPIKFALVGLISVAIDAAVYALFHSVVNWPIPVAKTLSFLAGAVFSYLANWRVTFGARRGKHSELFFVIVYLAALGINVLVNGVVLELTKSTGLGFAIAFCVATLASATWNYFGMALFVFTKPGEEEDMTSKAGTR